MKKNQPNNDKSSRADTEHHNCTTYNRKIHTSSWICDTAARELYINAFEPDNKLRIRVSETKPNARPPRKGQFPLQKNRIIVIDERDRVRVPMRKLYHFFRLLGCSTFWGYQLCVPRRYAMIFTPSYVFLIIIGEKIVQDAKFCNVEYWPRFQ